MSLQDTEVDRNKFINEYVFWRQLIEINEFLAIGKFLQVANILLIIKKLYPDFSAFVINRELILEGSNVVIDDRVFVDKNIEVANYIADELKVYINKNVFKLFSYEDLLINFLDKITNSADYKHKFNL